METIKLGCLKVMEYATQDKTFLITACPYILFSLAHPTQKSDQVHAFHFISPKFYLFLHGNLNNTISINFKPSLIMFSSTAYSTIQKPHIVFWNHVYWCFSLLQNKLSFGISVLLNLERVSDALCALAQYKSLYRDNLCYNCNDLIPEMVSWLLTIFYYPWLSILP